MDFDKVDRYDIVNVLGTGSFGVVLEAVDPKHPERHYAIKVQHEELAKDLPE